MQNINELINSKLAEIRKTHDHKHAEIVTTQQSQVVQAVSLALEEALSQVTGKESDNNCITICVYESDFIDPVQKETSDFMAQLGFENESGKGVNGRSWKLILKW